MRKKIGGSLWFAMILMILITAWNLITDFQLLWEDKTFWIYVAVILGIAAAAIITTRKPK